MRWMKMDRVLNNPETNDTITYLRFMYRQIPSGVGTYYESNSAYSTRVTRTGAWNLEEMARYNGLDIVDLDTIQRLMDAGELDENSGFHYVLFDKETKDIIEEKTSNIYDPDHLEILRRVR
jgi:hypothetical protein